MNTDSELYSQGFYIKELKPLLPEAAFKPDRSKMLLIFFYLGCVLGLYFVFRLTSEIVFHIVISIAIGHCLASFGFLAHELSHNAIIRNSYLKYPLEVIVWGINLIPATVWDRVHNQTHHAFMNTSQDPDRQFLHSEKNKFTTLYTQLFYPNIKFIKWNPLVGFHFIPYIFRNILSAFYPNRMKPDVVPFKPRYSIKQRIKIIFELAVIVLLQMFIFWATGGNLRAYIWAGPIAYLFASTILMVYIFTNHFLNPIHDLSDPLLTTTSVQVPTFFNKLHFNFAFHTEHHIFPSINSNFYPLLSKVLREKYPERYNYIKITDAWSKLWQNEMFTGKRNRPVRNIYRRK